ncbi:hypothetical protein [Nocardia miyunensis]|uniref:hypothetical protein n=1 Tax=Nocardia miyunensis TaxID=282684 RepID=UPI000836FFD8
MPPATRESMREATLALASGDVAAVSDNRIAEEISATWGAVKCRRLVRRGRVVVVGMMNSVVLERDL